MRWTCCALFACALLTAVIGCSNQSPGVLPTVPTSAAALTVQAPTFTNGALIRPRFTCDGVNLSPAVNWTGVPAGTQSIVVIVNDPDAPGGSYTHWLVYDIPPSVAGLGDAVGKAFDTTPEGGKQDLNSHGDLGYTGPCPPQGETHHYEINVYALNKELGLSPLTPRADVTNAMVGSIIGFGQLVAPYRREERTDGNVVFHLTPTP